jgi:hypothetical protein
MHVEVAIINFGTGIRRFPDHPCFSSYMELPGWEGTPGSVPKIVTNGLPIRLIFCLLAQGNTIP